MSNETVDPKVLGAYLLTKGFKTWFLFAFRMVEGLKFIVDPAHEESFTLFEDIYNQEKSAKRVNLNEPPRSSKTTLILYFFVFAALLGPCNFIYTTFSAQLLKDGKDRIKKITDSEWFKSCYGKYAFAETEEPTEFIDEIFKKEYEAQGVKFGNTKVMLGDTTIYLTPLGSTTGLGAGILGIKDKYTGGVFMDDINKVVDTLLNKTLNQKVKDYFSTNILTRINNEAANILNVQQRISCSDISAYLIEKYDFRTVIIALENEDESCNLPSQYSKERIGELKKDHRTWKAQYQQDPEPDEQISFIGQVFNYDTLVESARRKQPYEIDPYTCLGVDPKREGTDYFSIMLRTGKIAKVLFNDKRTFDIFTAADIIAKYADLYMVEDIIIDSGKGEGIVDELHKREYWNVREIKFGAESHRTDAFLKRGAMYNDLFDWINAGGVLPDYKALFDELLAQRFAGNANELFKLAPKEEVKKRIGRSPGLADALALTFAVPRPKRSEKKSEESYKEKILLQFNGVGQKSDRGLVKRVRL